LKKAILAAACSISVICVVCLSARPAASARAGAADAQPERAIAITVDDLPAGAANVMSASAITDMTRKLVSTLKSANVPAVGFVNERKLYFHWDEVNERIAALNIWLDAGFELGNHTYGHTSLNRVTLKEWEEAVIQGETVTRLLQAQHKMTMRYFRHPYLDTGRDLQTRREAEAFLVSRGYRIAPVTMDAWDWMYARIYDDAKKRGDSALEQEVVKSYLAHTTEVFAFYEKFSRDLLGYEPKQILLLHGNNLEADHIGELLELLRKRGYKFVTLQDALGDQAYSLPDTYVADEGTNWIDHWAISMGKPVLHSPDAPQAMVDRANAIPAPQP
jgi:peptidoglycan/xylan/chitin deacetylase (PgdA/CDA1 family)